ncbi:MAG TPA: two-component regulator propeller domain-containing protein, partial [Thermoanaerobaculia bacterium]
MLGPAPSSRAGRLLVGAGLALLATAAWCETLPVTRFTTREGLAGNRIKRIVADPSGFLWFCTASGLSRYDGHAFTSYGVAEGLPDTSVNDLLVAADGSYWVATNGGGVAAFRPHTTEGPLFVPLATLDEAPGSRRVNALHQSAGGRIWAGTDAGLFSWHPGEGEGELRRAPFAGGPEADSRTPVWSFAEDPEGRLWIGTSRGLYAIGADGTRARYRVGSSASTDVVGTVVIDRRRRLWLGHEDGLVVLSPGPSDAPAGSAPSLAAGAAPCLSPAADGETGASLPRAPGEACRWRPPGTADLSAVRRLYEDGEGRVWVGSDAGLFSFQEGRLASYRDALAFPSRSLMALAEDAGGNLWVGTAYHGAARLALDGFVTYGEADGLGDAFATSVFSGPRGELYAVTRNRLVHRLEGDRLVAVRPNLPDLGPEGGRVETHHGVQDRYGDWWFPTRRGLYRFPAVATLEELAWRTPLGPYTTRDGLAGDEARHVFPDSRGDLWVTTRHPGREVLSRWERSTGTFHRYSAEDGLPPYNPAMSFLEHPHGTLWIGFWEGG